MPAWLSSFIGVLILHLATVRVAGAQGWEANARAFRADMDALREPLGIPGLAYAVVHDGRVITKEALGSLTTGTPLRIASVTKALAAVVVLQQVQAGTVSLDARVKPLLPAFDGPDEVTLRHLLSHTSEGEVGQGYVYSSSRYARVGDVLQAATGQRFEQLLRRGVLEPAGMRWYESPELGTHAALVSTVDEMVKLLLALDAGRVLEKKAQATLAIPPLRTLDREPLPVSLGWFTQEVQGRRIVWSFGQDEPDHSSALLLRVPDQGWSLFVLADRNTMSDAFRLLMGDARKSPVATAFLRSFAFSPAGQPRKGLGTGSAREVLARVAAQEAGGDYRYADELLGRALTRRWAGDAAGAEELLFATLERYRLGETPDMVLHFAAAAIGTPRSRAWGIGQGERLLASHPGNRWVRLAQANLLAAEPARAHEAVGQYQAILDLPNQAPDFLHRLFRSWSLSGIARIVRDELPARIR